MCSFFPSLNFMQNKHKKNHTSLWGVTFPKKIRNKLNDMDFAFRFNFYKI